MAREPSRGRLGPWVDLRGLDDLLRRINRRRRDGAAAEADERWVEAVFGASRHLAVYGSLAPGRANHGQVEGIRGTWRTGFVCGTFSETGWGVTMGYPAIRLGRDRPRVPVHVLVSDELRRHWARLDEFEGPEYTRSLALVVDEAGPGWIANLYEAR